MKLNISIILFFLFFLISCSLDKNNNITEIFIEKKNTTVVSKKNTNTKILKKNININSNLIDNENISKDNNKDIKSEIIQKYYIGDPYFIDGIKYKPKEDYSYIQTGLASFYDAELHRKKTINNEYNNVTELLARHKTLPIPSVVKITNLENGLSVNVRVNDRGPKNNVRIIEVSRKVAQLLRFYKSKIAKVRVEIISDPSKQLKIVTQSMSDSHFNDTLDSAPTELVTITDLKESVNDDLNTNLYYESPIELGFEEILQSDLFLKISGFHSYEEAKSVKNVIKRTFKFTTEKENEGYSIIFGPLTNKETDNLFQILVTKGYKKSEIIIK